MLIYAAAHQGPSNTSFIFTLRANHCDCQPAQ